MGLLQARDDLRLEGAPQLLEDVGWLAADLHHDGDLLARPATDRHLVDPDRFPGLTVLQDRRECFGVDRRVVLTHSVTLHAAQARGFDQTLAKAAAKLTTLADTLARANTRRGRDKVTTEINKIVKDPWVRRVISWQLTGNTPAAQRLSFDLDEAARTDLEAEIFGKRVLMTDSRRGSYAGRPGLLR